MAGNTSAINIVSNSLLLIGHQSISNFSDGTVGAELATALYEDSIKFLLTTHRWRFATKQTSLNKLTESPLEGYNNIFQLPLDLVYLQKVHRVRNYEIFDDKLYTNADEINIDYTYRQNEDKFPSYFTKMAEFYLASQFAVPITGNATRAQYYAVAYDDARRKATNLDSSQRPNQAITSNPFLDVRR